MSWLSKALKRTTKILDPVGAKIRKSTGGSYGDPLNYYNSKPNTTKPWQPSPSPGLMSAPNGQTSLGTTNIGGDSGGRSYVPNQFQAGGPYPNVPGLTAPQGGKSSALPSGPMKNPSMSFGGVPMGGAMNSVMQTAQGQMQPQQQNQMIGQQQAMINALRGRMV